jgi:RNA polymerase sigma-70 factor (ECF subfamily)
MILDTKSGHTPSPAPTLSPEQIVLFRAPVRRFVGARVRNDAAADDLTQEIFIRVLKQLPRVKDHRRVMGWVFQIARNVVSDYFRAARPTEIYREPETAESGAQPEAVEREESMLRDELSLYVRGVVKSLPPVYREALLLTDYEGMSQVEMAKHLGIGLSAAKSRVQRARRMVREIVETCCHVEFDSYGTLVDMRERQRACACGDSPSPSSASACG